MTRPQQELPFELITMISEFCDDITKYKLHMLLDYKVCCSYEKQFRKKDKHLYSYFDEDEFHYCDVCGKYICYYCYESGEIHVDNCYRCNKSVCSHCNDDGELLRGVWISRCTTLDCYYCRRGYCYNNKREWCCEDCITKFNYELSEN